MCSVRWLGVHELDRVPGRVAKRSDPPSPRLVVGRLFEGDASSTKALVFGVDVVHFEVELYVLSVSDRLADVEGHARTPSSVGELDEPWRLRRHRQAEEARIPIAQQRGILDEHGYEREAHL